MSIVRTLIGNIKGPAGATGATGATGAAGANGADGTAATISVGTVSTTAYGNPAEVTNSGTSSAAVFDFVIPQGQPGEEVTDMSGLTLGTMTTQTAQYPTPQIGDNGATLWGKVVKYFSDLRTAIGTKLNTANVVNNFTTTESGYALDARAGKTLNDSLTPTSVPISFAENNYYSDLGAGQDSYKLAAYKSGHVATIRVSIRCNTPDDTSPGQQIAVGFPRPAMLAFVDVPPSLGASAGKSLRCYLTSSGQLYARYGETNKAYDVLITYVTQ